MLVILGDGGDGPGAVEEAVALGAKIYEGGISF
jgi:hypothetical protein